ncbi:MAG: ATP synthase F1 subunit epsilon [Actinomycetota bacterium]|nr:ATP synthase F1 subunit epsilon [Actinomycetota bacterium]
MTLHVEVVSPERILWTGEAEMVSARTVGGGDIAFLTGHAPFVGALDIGKVTVRPQEGSSDVLVAVHGGFVEVSNDRVTILSDVAELQEQIDVSRAQAALAKAEAELKAEGLNPDAEEAKRRADLRLVVSGATAGTAAH